MKYNKNHTVYLNSLGTEVPSVTTILKILNKPFLAKWANAMGFKRQKIDDILERSSQIGTLVHQMVEAFMLKKYYIWTGPIQGKRVLASYLDSFLNWKLKHEVEPIFMENQFTSELYGGTVDFYGIVDGKKTILDFKTSKKVYSSMFLQLAAYCAMLEEQGYEVEQVAIIIINESRHAEKFMSREELQPYIDIFKLLAALFHNWYEINMKDGWGDILA